MRKEIENWWKQAQRDFLSASHSFESQDFYVSVFFCHQAVEKALKTLVMLKQKKREIVSHSLIFLGKEANIPEKFHDFLRELTPEYTVTRYPSVGGETPFELYGMEQAKKFMEKTREVLAWTRKQVAQQKNSLKE